MNYGFQLQNLRERLGVSQKQVADLLKIDKSLYRKYEKEIQTIPTKHLNTICNYYKVSIDYILNFNDNKNYSDNIENIDYRLVGERLKTFRKEHKITQIELAKILNTVQPVITNYEKGKHLIALPFLYTICKKYNISADYLLGKTNELKYLK